MSAISSSFRGRRGSRSTRSLPMAAAVEVDTRSTSSCVTGSPNAFVRLQIPSTRMPRACAGRDSGTIDMPTMVAPSPREHRRPRPGVSKAGPRIAAYTPSVGRDVQRGRALERERPQRRVIDRRALTNAGDPVGEPPPQQRHRPDEVQVVAHHHGGAGRDARAPGPRPRRSAPSCRRRARARAAAAAPAPLGRGPRTGGSGR